MQRIYRISDAFVLCLITFLYHILPNCADVFAFVLIFKFELEQREAESKG